MNLSKKTIRFTSILLLAAFLTTTAAFGTPNEQAKKLLDKTGITKGICVILDDPKCDLAIEMAKQSELLIYVQLQKDSDLQAARKAVDNAGLYNKSIYIEKGTLDKVHLADNLADVLIALNNATSISKTEVLRVLRPEGKALIGSTEFTKPFPKGSDDWSHPYHGPDNNPQSQDQIVRAPYLTQFLADPRYGPPPQVAVISAGRAFKAYGHIAFHKREEALLNTLVAYNAYNGTELWRRPLTPGIMVHRNTMIATPTKLYVGDDKSCKIIDTVTGKLIDEIIPPTDIAGGTFWKWMALENGILYAMVGEQEQKDPIMAPKRERHGWPWKPMSPGYNQPKNPWGYGKNVLAIDPATKKVLWHYHEDKPIDSRAMCMKNGKIYFFAPNEFLTSLDAKTGAIRWRKTPQNDPDLFAEIGEELPRQDYRTNFRTTVYLKCSDKALYFSGPTVDKLLAVSTENGSVLWKHPYDNFQIVLHNEELYAFSGQNDINCPSMKFDPLTGKILAELKMGRRACTRPTGSCDAIFIRAYGGTTRIDTASDNDQWISPMRPPCHDGVTIANGLLYWWPWCCDCELSLFGLTSLGPAGDFNFTPTATDSQRLNKVASPPDWFSKMPKLPTDWPTFRANNKGTATTEANVSKTGDLLWKFTPKTKFTATAPTTAYGQTFVSGSDGIVRAIDIKTGKTRWTAYTGGSVRIPPTIYKARAYVGSGDGYVYCFKANTGQLLWRFRTAPQERKIPVYGTLLSTWPAASGVLIEDGTAYVAAGIVNYDGTYVFALDTETGKIKWQNNSSGHLDPESRTGVSVQGHMLLYNGKLCLAGGTTVSPAVYDATNGKCLNDPSVLKQLAQNNNITSQSPRGWELFLIENMINVSGQPYYQNPKYPSYDRMITKKMLLTSSGNKDIAWLNNTTLVCFAHVETNRANLFTSAWGKPKIEGLKPLWKYGCPDSVALAVGKNAAVVASKTEVVAMNLEDGSKLWSKPLPSQPVPWGLALDRNGKVIVTLEDGQILCFGQNN